MTSEFFSILNYLESYFLISIMRWENIHTVLQSCHILSKIKKTKQAGWSDNNDTKESETHYVEVFGGSTLHVAKLPTNMKLFAALLFNGKKSEDSQIRQHHATSSNCLQDVTQQNIQNTLWPTTGRHGRYCSSHKEQSMGDTVHSKWEERGKFKDKYINQSNLVF